MAIFRSQRAIIQDAHEKAFDPAWCVQNFVIAGDDQLSGNLLTIEARPTL